MDFVCVGGSRFKEPLAGVQKMRICSFVEELHLSNPVLL
jgi:hypothetical protein